MSLSTPAVAAALRKSTAALEIKAARRLVGEIPKSHFAGGRRASVVGAAARVV